MPGLHVTRPQVMVRLVLAGLAAAATAGLALALCGCGSSGASPPAPSTAPVKTAIVKLLPRDASAEPPWNGRFVQVNVRTAEPAAMDPGDWRVFVNGRQPELEKPPSILPFSATAAVVAFSFEVPYGDPGTYAFRVVYEPAGGPKVQQAWEYAW